MPSSKSKSLYSVHPGIVMVQKWIEALPAKTGRSLDEWVALVQTAGPPDLAAQREWLKREHKLGTNSAWWIADRANGIGGEEDTPAGYLQAAEGYVAAMFDGAKAGLRPIYDVALAFAFTLGKDVKACPGKTIVPLYRQHVFAQLKPTTRTRLDLGLCLKGVKLPAQLPDRLIDTGGAAKGDRITHRIGLSFVSDLDEEAKRWLRTAYEQEA